MRQPQVDLQALSFRVRWRAGKTEGREMARRAVFATISGLLCLFGARTILSAEPASVGRIVGNHAGGAGWAIDMPEKWNGTLLLYAHGYSPVRSTAPPESAPREARQTLLAEGYALAASAFSAAGWALAEAPRDQMEVLDQFVQRFGQPRRTIAWGSSMGGLVSLALAERHPSRIHAAMPFCASVSGSLGMLNTALDGAHAFRTLLAPDSAIRIVKVDDDRANAARATAVLQEAWQTPAGKARVLLAAALARLPAWSDAAAPQPDARDFAAQAEQLRRTFVMGVFVPRVDQETRAGGVYAWNTGVDYRRLLADSPLLPLVRHYYSAAALDLAADLDTLNAAPRIAADPAAVAYMRANFIPAGNWRVPVLTLQTIGDGLTVPATHAALSRLTRDAGRSRMLAQLWIDGAGHCTFRGEELRAALSTLEHRLDSGRWSTRPTSVAQRAAAGTTRFIQHTPPDMPRHCGARAGSCRGEPPPAAPRP
jgi:pimeloyl-ACP methyl ester carboxylesterase